nr:MAG TPA: hypothetical protein [Caudoviricetes sp.]
MGLVIQSLLIHGTLDREADNTTTILKGKKYIKRENNSI